MQLNYSHFLPTPSAPFTPHPPTPRLSRCIKPTVIILHTNLAWEMLSIHHFWNFRQPFFHFIVIVLQYHQLLLDAIVFHFPLRQQAQIAVFFQRSMLQTIDFGPGESKPDQSIGQLHPVSGERRGINPCRGHMCIHLVSVPLDPHQVCFICFVSWTWLRVPPRGWGAKAADVPKQNKEQCDVKLAGIGRTSIRWEQ